MRLIRNPRSGARKHVKRQTLYHKFIMKLSAQIQLQHLIEPSGLPSVLLSSWDAC